VPIYRKKQEDYDRVQQHIAEERPRQEPTLANIEAATTEHSPMLLRYRGRVFLVPPVPYRQGLWLLALDQELRRLQVLQSTVENIRHTMNTISQVLAIFHQLVRPVTWFDRLVWRWRANPFLHAEVHELQELLRFFCLTRTSSPIGAVLAFREPHFISWTWPMRKPRLPIGIHAGWHRMESPAVSDTTISA